MSDVNADNVAKHIAAKREEARLAESAHQYFTGTAEGKKLLKRLEHETGANFPAFTGKDNFNSHSAAFRDGMRASYLIIANLIKHHQENHEPRTESHD